MDRLQSYILTYRGVNGLYPLCVFTQHEADAKSKTIQITMRSTVCSGYFINHLDCYVKNQHATWLQTLVCETVLLDGEFYCISRVYDAIDCEQSYTVAAEKPCGTPEEIQPAAERKGTSS